MLCRRCYSWWFWHDPSTSFVMAVLETLRSPVIIQELFELDTQSVHF